MNNSSTGTCIYFFFLSEPKSSPSPEVRFYVYNHHHPDPFCTRSSILDPRFLGSFVCKLSLGFGTDSTLFSLDPFLSQPFSLLGFFLSISFFSISSPSIRPSVTTPYVRLRSVGLDSVHRCRYSLFPFCFLFLVSCLLPASFFLLPFLSSLSPTLLFSSARRLELIRLLGWLALWVGRPNIGSTGLLFGWVGFTHHAS